MKVRNPVIDYTAVRPHWAPIPEFAQDYNAKSLVPAYIEPFLIQVMRRAKTLLSPDEVDLHEDIAIFIRQESQHCKQHVAFNEMMRRHYPKMKEIEDDYAAEYKAFLRDRPLKFNLAYAEGFEALGAIGGEVFFEDLDDLLEGADANAVLLWKWHLAEEFEHRHVCAQLYKTLYCSGGWNRFWNGYVYRVWIFLYAIKHIGHHVNRFASHLEEVDRQARTPAEQAASEQRRRLLKQRGRKRLARLLPVLSPFYDPAKKAVPAGLTEYLGTLEQRSPATSRPA
jgi:predicted metal-dependent hydrolase